MSNEKQETIADIVADIRAQNQGLPKDSYALSPLVCDLLSFADRIEAAAKREREAGAEAAQICGEIGEMIGMEATREKSSQVGNVAKMREVLSDACYAMFNFLKTQNGGYEEMAKALDKAKATLAEPPRNCDRPECATSNAAQCIWNDEDGGKTAYYEWLLQKHEEGCAK